MTIRHKGIGVLVAAGTLTLGCADDGPFLNFQRQELTESGPVSAGDGCLLTHAGGGTFGATGGTADGDFTTQEVGEDQEWYVVVRSRNEVLARRTYDLDFLYSGEVDRFEVTTHAGRRYELTYYGSPECATASAEE